MTLITEWSIATRFLREGKAQSALILLGIGMGVAVIVFITALINGLQSNTIERTLGTQAHIRVQPADEQNLVAPPAAGVTQLLLEDKRAQRLRSINNWQELRNMLDQLPYIKAVSPVVRSEEHTSELQSRENLVCRLLLEKKKNTKQLNQYTLDNSISVRHI